MLFTLWNHSQHHRYEALNVEVFNSLLGSDGNTVEVDFDCCTVLPAETEVSTSSREELPPPSVEEEEEEEEEEGQRCWASSSSALQLNKPSPGLSMEDPLKMMDSILKESGAVSQNINLLGK